MYLSALTIGYAVPGSDFEAVTHGVFQSAANLQLTKAGKLITLVGSGEADLPQGIRLDTPTDFSFAGLGTGEAVTCRDGILRINSISLTADLCKVRIWKCDLPALNVDMTNAAVGFAWRSVWEALNKRQLLSGAEIVADNLFNPDEIAQSVISRRAGEAIRALVDATRQRNLDDISMLNTLIGLGTGLTPSGDDLLVGYLAGLWCLVRGRPDREQFISGLGRRVVRLSRRTNDISRTYLYHAARGQVSSRLAALAEAISRGESGGPLLSTAKSAMRVGHTSGMDAVTGLLFGLATWDILPFINSVVPIWLQDLPWLYPSLAFPSVDKVWNMNA